MHKLFPHLVTILLAPCLIADPIFAYGFSESLSVNSSQTESSRTNFEQEALNLPDTHFPEGFGVTQTASEYRNESHTRRVPGSGNLESLLDTYVSAAKSDYIGNDPRLDFVSPDGNLLQHVLINSTNIFHIGQSDLLVLKDPTPDEAIATDDIITCAPSMVRVTRKDGKTFYVVGHFFSRRMEGESSFDDQSDAFLEKLRQLSSESPIEKIEGVLYYSEPNSRNGETLSITQDVRSFVDGLSNPEVTSNPAARVHVETVTDNNFGRQKVAMAITSNGIFLKASHPSKNDESMGPETGLPLRSFSWNQKPDSLPEPQNGIASPASGEKTLIPFEKKTSEKKPASQLEISNGALRLILFYFAGVLREDDHLIPFHDKGMNEPGTLVHHIQRHIDRYPSLRPLLAIQSEVERNRQAIEMVNLLRKLEPEPYRHAGRSARLFASLWETLTDAERVPHSIDAILMGYLVDVASGRSRPIHWITVQSDMIRRLTTHDEEDRRPWETTLLQHPEWMMDISFHMVDLGPEVEELGRFDDKAYTRTYYSKVLGQYFGKHLNAIFSAKGGSNVSWMPLLEEPEPLVRSQDPNAPIHMSFIGDVDGVAVVQSLGVNALNQIYHRLGFQKIRPPNVVIQVSRLAGADQKMVYKITRTDGATFVLYVPTKTEPLDEMNTLGPLSKASTLVVKFGGQFDVMRDGETITVVAAEYLSGATVESVIENGALIGRKPSIPERLSIEGEIVRAYFDVWIRSGRFIQDNIRQASSQTTCCTPRRQDIIQWCLR